MVLTAEERARFVEWLNWQILDHQSRIDNAARLVAPLPGSVTHRMVVECTALKLVCNRLTGLERTEFRA